MHLRADPILLAVALGFLNPTVFQVDGDVSGEDSPPPMINAIDDDDVAQDADDSSESAVSPERTRSRA